MASQEKLSFLFVHISQEHFPLHQGVWGAFSHKLEAQLHMGARPFG